MAFTSAQYTITTSAQVIVPDDIYAEEVHLHVNGGICYIGDATVTTSNGLRLDNGDKITFSTHNGPLYALTNTGTLTLYVGISQK